MNTHIIILDTSAILSGKPLTFPHSDLVTCPGVVSEIQPGGIDYRNFEYLQARGLQVIEPTQKAMSSIRKHIETLGEHHRLSEADTQLLALAFMYHQQGQPYLLLSDDYSIQNSAASLSLYYQSVTQKGITKRFKWHWRCPGCKKHFHTFTEKCPICGMTPKHVPSSKASIQTNGEQP
jgi:UPF0271 protein